ncbi:MAG: ankyrin repeat domain-containing protein [Pseudomonadota bacterium]|nr:ankyrin repeat domain-containing protein [Pseudomonadota bacterium]
MPEATPRPTPKAARRPFPVVAGAALGAGALLAALAGLGGAAAAFGATLAQPAFALAVSGWRRGAAGATVRRDAVSLAVLWAATVALFAALLAWPFSVLLASGSLGATLATSLAFGLALLAAWRLWPLWHGVERDGGGVESHWQALARFESGAWRGLAAAAMVIALAALPLLLAWPGLLDSRGRWILALGSIAVAPLLHALLQGVRAPEALPERWLEDAFDEADADDTTAAGAPLLAPGQSPEAALYAAARSGRVDRALALLEAGADPHAPPPGEERDQRSLPVLAAVLPDLRLLRALIGRGIDLNAEHAGMTPLLAATRDSWHGRPEAVMTLLANGADPRARDSEGNTPLHHAARSSDPGVAALLRDAAAELEERNDDGLTPLGIACASGNWRLARFMLERGAKAQSDEGTPALIAAASVEEDDAAGVQLLLKHKARVDARDAAGRSALHEAAFAGHVEIIQALLAAHAELDARDGEGRTPLIAAVAGGRLAAVEALAEAGADTAAVDNEGQGALDHAVAAGRWSLVTALDPDYPLPAAVAVDAVDPDAADEALVEVEVEIDPEVRAGMGDNRVFGLLARGADGVAELQGLLHRGHAPAGAGGLARFLEACVAEDQAGGALERFALELLERGADPFTASASGDPPLSLAVRLGWPRLVERLLTHGVDPATRDSRGMTALHLAAALGREQPLKLLVLHGASPELRAADGQTPLGVALSSGRRDLVDWLDWKGWPLPRRALRPGDLPAAAIVGDADAVRRLLDLGFPIDAVDNQGCTALLRASGGGHRPCVELLLERGADPQAAARTGATPLSAAVSMRHGEIVDRLLAAHAGLEQRLPGEVTVLMLAAALGLPDLCARLLQAGANVHAGDAQGLTPLHCAVLFAFTAREKPRVLALLDTLLLAGAEPDMAAAGNVTPLLLLLGARAEPGTACDEEVLLTALERLLDEEVALDVQDPRGFGPLHLAALHGLLRITQRLLRAGCDPNLRDGLNRSPREIAVMRGFVDVAAEYAPATPGVSMARFLREP